MVILINMLLPTFRLNVGETSFYPGSQTIILQVNIHGPVVKGWPMEIFSTYIQEHNLGEQPCNFIAKNAQKAKSQDGHHTYLIHNYNFLADTLNFLHDIMASKGFLYVKSTSGTILLIMGLCILYAGDHLY